MDRVREREREGVIGGSVIEKGCNRRGGSRGNRGGCNRREIGIEASVIEEGKGNGIERGRDRKMIIEGIGVEKRRIEGCNRGRRKCDRNDRGRNRKGSVIEEPKTKRNGPLDGSGDKSPPPEGTSNSN